MTDNVTRTVPIEMKNDGEEFRISVNEIHVESVTVVTWINGLVIYQLENNRNWMVPQGGPHSDNQFFSDIETSSGPLLRG